MVRCTPSSLRGWRQERLIKELSGWWARRIKTEDFCLSQGITKRPVKCCSSEGLTDWFHSDADSLPQSTCLHWSKQKWDDFLLLYVVLHWGSWMSCLTEYQKHIEPLYTFYHHTQRHVMYKALHHLFISVVYTIFSLIVHVKMKKKQMSFFPPVYLF